MHQQGLLSYLNGLPYHVLIVEDLGLSLFGEIRSTGALGWDHSPYP